MRARTPSLRKARPQPESDSDAASYDDLLQSIRGPAEQMEGLSQLAVAQYTPVVESIIRTRSRDVNHIELTLDGLLDFCHSEPALALFKQLCRYYWTLDPAATAAHVYAYKDMWGDEAEPKSKAASPPPSPKRTKATRPKGGKA